MTQDSGVRPPPYTAEELRAVGALLHGTFERLSAMPSFETDTPLRQVLGEMMGAACSRLYPIEVLLQLGALAEAATLGRTILELEISAAYISSAPSGDESEQRARRFQGFAPVQKYAMAQRLLGHEQQEVVRAMLGTPDAKAKLDQLKSAAADAQQAFPGIEDTIAKGWSGLGIYRMIPNIHDESLRKQLESKYGLTYSSLSNYAHPTPAGLQHVLPGARPDPAVKYGVPLFAAASAIHIAQLAAAVGDVKAPATLDLLQAFEATLPAGFREA